MNPKIQRIIIPFGWLAIGFFFYPLLRFEHPKIETSELRPEIAIVEVQALQGDQLQIEIFGPARILWAQDKSLEAEGLHHIPLGQLPDLVDLEFKKFAYTANAKTGKFYPSDSYPARGTAVRDRRFFQTKAKAIAAGFIPTKLVK